MSADIQTPKSFSQLTTFTAFHQCSRIRIFRFFSDFKKHDFLRFFEMTYQKVVKSHQQKFSPQYVTKEWSLLSMITVIQFDPRAIAEHFSWSDQSVGTKLQTQRDWGQSSWPCLRPFKPQTVAEVAVVGLPGSKRRVGTLGSVRFWQQWRGTINIKQGFESKHLAGLWR